jgi:hypothetical protein
MLKKISFAIVIGIIVTIFFAQYDPWTHKKIVLLLQKIARESLDGNVTCSIQSVNFFSPSLVLYDVEMKAFDAEAWSWRCKKCEVTCSWLQLLYKGRMDQHVVMDGFECNSTIENFRPTIEPHVIAMMQQSFLPFVTEVKSIVFKNAHFNLHDNHYKTDASFSFNSSSLRVGNYIKTAMSVMDGVVKHEDKTYIENAIMDVSMTTEWVDNAFDIRAQVAGTFVLPHMAHQGVCYVTGGWTSNRGRFSVRNAYNSLMIDPIIITEHELCINAHVPLSYAVQCATHSTTHQIIDGKIHFSAKIDRQLFNVDGQIVVEDAAINNHHLCDVAKIIFGRHEDEWKMKFAINRCNQEYKGTGHWHELIHRGELIVKNVTDCGIKSLPYWRIKPHNFFVHAVVDHDIITGNYEMIVTNTLRDAAHCSNGSFSYIKNVATAQGCIDENRYILEAAIYPQVIVHHCMYKDKENKQLIALQATDDKKQVKGLISFPFIRSLINTLLHYDVQGEGNVGVIASLSPTEIVADLALHNATIRLPQTYNFIDGFHAHCTYTIDKGLVVLEDVNLSLYTGKISCLRATSYFDDTGSLVFMHAPVIMDRCLLNIKKDLFAIVSGNFLFSKNAASPARVDGHVIIDKAQLKENLFSGIIQKQLLSYTHSVFSLPDVPLQCDLSIETKLPIVVDTGFLQTNAHVNLRVQKDVNDPIVTGSLVLHSGMLNFPYKPLYISKGCITFPPEQLFNPTIELFARNKIKKYDISLQVEGSLLAHQISLDATPPLSEEQIVGLLLVGTEENSLNSMMPALIVQNLKNLIFSNNQSSFFDKYFKPLLGSFNINLVPSFTDQTGRGGLRGALEITLDDRWRAVIQKNFSLTEDTKFELEFLLSDDMTLRAIRDERRDLGGEVEMRWKF